MDDVDEKKGRGEDEIQEMDYDKRVAKFFDLSVIFYYFFYKII